ncbi:hypothetical protein CIB48_g4407 [Xylaria polymorpha]|nr:hypothetical protein CIB48_g4407 [Xylaria polymorpha]
MTPAAAGVHDVKIAPITQPNYTFLRIDKGLLQNDVIDHVDIHNATPANRNPRVTDLGTGKTRANRLGVYLHWIIPRPYRSGNASSLQKKKGEDTPSNPNAAAGNGKDDPTAPKLREPPNRWLIVRRIDPKTAKPPGKVPRTEAWVIESDRIRNIDQLDADCDLQVDVSPFVTSTAKLADPNNKAAPIDGIDLSQQAETFIGYKKDFQSWLDQDQKFDRGEKKDAPERVRLSLLNSSNQLFPDYQPHNSNVFSMVDNFAYENTTTDGPSVEYLTDAVADYYVLGWHSNDANGLLAEKSVRETALNNLCLKLNDKNNDSIEKWLSATASADTICHGAMYQVKWHNSWSQPTDRPTVPGDKFTYYLTKELPVGIGNTSLDSMLAYISAHNDTKLEKDLKALGPLLRAQSDSLSDQQAGQDEVQNYNFMQLPGGTRYVFPGEKSEPARTPPAERLQALRELNEAQTLLDAAQRIYRKKQWDLFAIWWKFVTSPNLEDSQSADRIKYTDQRNKIMKTMTVLDIIINREQGEVNDKVALFGSEIQTSALPEFVQLRDPTIFIGGARSGWPTDYLDELRCRIDQQIGTYQPSEQTDNKPPFLNCLPAKLQDTAHALLKEFLLYSPMGADITVGDSTIPTYPPLYHDQGDPDGKINPDPNALWRDSWSNTQAWFPLFLEWEAEYFHIDFEKWQLNDSTARLNNKQLLRYGIKPDNILYNDKRVDRDQRIVSGRMLLLLK